ncbi:hypothetical protein B7463_g20, partial [Scytalidium lignicola]
MTSSDELRARHRGNRQATAKLEKCILFDKKCLFDAEYLRNINIRKIQVSFDNKTSELGPCFFAPYPQDNLDQPTPGWMAQEFPSYHNKGRPIDHARDLCYFLAYYLAGYRIRKQNPEQELQQITYNAGWFQDGLVERKLGCSLFEHSGYSEYPPQWQVMSLFFHEDIEFPHAKVIMISNIEGDDEMLSRGEILALLRVIRIRLKQAAYAMHDFHPVLMLSLMGPQHLRLIQGHFDGTDLVLQHSKVYNMLERDEDTLIFLTSWLYGPPLNTTRKELK